MCDLEATGAPPILRLIHSASVLSTMLPTLDLSRTPSDGSGTGWIAKRVLFPSIFTEM